MTSKEHEAPHCAISSTSPYLLPLRPKYHPQHPILKHPQPMFLPQRQEPSFTPIQNKKRTYTPVYTRWFKYDGDNLCVNKSQFVQVIFEPPCTNPSMQFTFQLLSWRIKRPYTAPWGGGGYAVVQLVEALLCKSEGRGFDSRWSH
jgi:hypothetical protein